MRLVVTLAGGAALVAALWLGVLTHPAEPVYACTGGVANLETFASRAGYVFLGDAITVGGSSNTAPAATPEATQTPIPPNPSATPPPPSPTIPPAPIHVPAVNLTGIGATFHIVADYSRVGSQDLVIDNDIRGFVERGLRSAEAGTPLISNCALDAFVMRYTPGARYLVFAEGSGNGEPFATAAFRVTNEQIVFDDSGLMAANNGFLYMERATYDRYFARVPATELGADAAYFTTGSVPLRDVLRAVADLRGDQSIAPPETGSAGLAAER